MACKPMRALQVPNAGRDPPYVPLALPPVKTAILPDPESDLLIFPSFCRSDRPKERT